MFCLHAAFYSAINSRGAYSGWRHTIHECCDRSRVIRPKAGSLDVNEVDECCERRILATNRHTNAQIWLPPQSKQLQSISTRQTNVYCASIMWQVLLIMMTRILTAPEVYAVHDQALMTLVHGMTYFSDKYSNVQLELSSGYTASHNATQPFQLHSTMNIIIW